MRQLGFIEQKIKCKECGHSKKINVPVVIFEGEVSEERIVSFPEKFFSCDKCHNDFMLISKGIDYNMRKFEH